MSILSKLKSDAGGKAATSAEIAEQIKAAETDIARLDGELGEVELAELMGDATAAKKAADMRERIQQLHATVERLQRVRRVTVQREAEEQERARARLLKIQIRNCKERLAARDAAAIALEAAIVEACKQFRTLVDKSVGAREACPLTREWPAGSLCEFGDLRQLVEEALWKHGANPVLGARDHFPGGRSTTLLMHQPEKIPSLAAKVMEASEYVIGVLSGPMPRSRADAPSGPSERPQ